MIKKSLQQLVAIAACLTIIGAPGLASAQDVSPELLKGQTHKYSAHFRGNGEAVVDGRIVFHNQETSAQRDVELGITGEIYELVVLQQILPQRCLKQDYSQTDKKYTCVSYEDPDYINENNENYYYGSTNQQQVQYKKLAPTKNGNVYNIPLNQPVEASKSGALIVRYATKSYAKASLGNIKFDFETFKVKQRVNEVKATVTFDDDVYYAGKRASTEYAKPETFSTDAGLDSVAASNSLSRYVSKIGSGGVIEKSASSLAPGDTFHVKGTYANSWLAFYRTKIILIVLGVGALIMGFYFFSRWRGRSKPKPKQPDTPTGSGSAQAETPKPELAQASDPSVRIAKMKVLNFWVTPLFGSFLYALFSLLATGLMTGVILALLAGVVDERNYGGDWINSALPAMASVAAVLVAIPGLFALPTLMARRRDLRYFFITLIFQAMWVLLAMLILAQFSSPPTDSYPAYRDYPM